MNSHGGKKDLVFLLKKSSIALTVKAGGMLTQYLFLFTIARFLGPGALGSFTLSFTVLQLASVLAIMGLDNLLLRKVAAASANNNLPALKSAYLGALQITSISSLVLAAAIYLTAPLLAGSLFSKPWLSGSFQTVSIALPFFVLSTLHTAAFRGLKNMLGFTLFRTLTPLVNTVIITGSWFIGTKVNPVTGLSLAITVLTIMYFIAWYRYSRIGTVNSASHVPKAQMISEALPMMITGSVFFILNWMDNLVIGIYRPEVSVGIYDTAFKIASAATAVLLAVNAVQAPTFAELHSRGNHERLRQYVFSSTRLLFYTTAPITALLLIAPEFILNLFGPGFSEGSLSLRILAIGNFVNCITGSVGILLMMTGFQKEYNRIVLAASIIAIALNFTLVPMWGIKGAAISSTISKIIWNLGSVVFVYKKLGIVSIYLPGISKWIISPGKQDA
jgi:O-antigen/teichoic acid export membrane protein